MVVFIFTGFDFAWGSLNKGVSINDTCITIKSNELPIINRSRLDDSLQAEFLAMFECAELGNFVLSVDQDAHTVGLKTWINIQVLAPVEHTLEMPLFDEMSLDVDCLQQNWVVSEIFNLIFELFVLFDAVGDIDV